MYLAIDIGGTKTLIALFSKRGRVLRRKKFRTPQGSNTFLRELENNLSDFKKRKIRSIVVAIPGVVQKNYSVKFGNRKWDEIDIFTPIKNLFNCPIWFENDANLAVLYESYRLPGKTVFLTFSTGIGGGIAEKNHILPESNEFEPGHKMYWYDGEVREWEDIAAASAIENYYHVDKATDLKKKEILQDIAQRIYLGLPDIVKKYRPDTIVLGGPMGKIFKLYSEYLPQDLGVKYRRPKRPNESVIYGCYLYA
ncbi:ROK family protein, partial [Candidatus Saccharibacteria bacterium]|nr:ROK family protein [Candidatus Saccharibacteria bacterium]